jgi:hypothetical protein
LSCWLNDVGAVPMAIPASIADLSECVAGASRKGGQVPELNVSETAANACQITRVDDTANRKSSHSQMGNNF